jgi:hypothetical protein
VWLHSRSVSGLDTPVWTLRSGYMGYIRRYHCEAAAGIRKRTCLRGTAGCPSPRWHRRIGRSKPEPVNKQSCQHKYCDEDDGLGADVRKENQWSLHTPLRRLADRSRPIASDNRVAGHSEAKRRGRRTAPGMLTPRLQRPRRRSLSLAKVLRSSSSHCRSSKPIVEPAQFLELDE